MRSDLRQPRVRARLVGIELSGIVAAEVESNNHFSADRFRLRFAAHLVEQELLHIPGGQVEIEFGNGDSWTSVVVGLIDVVSFDPMSGVVDVEGRDLSSQLIETQTDDTFANRTASEIATLLGLRHGLLVAADPTTTPVGRYYQSEHDRVALGQFAKTMTEWDLLAYLASREGFDLFMIGRTLRFGLVLPIGSRAIKPEDCISLHLSHSTNLARPIDVQVRSWNSKTGEVATGEAATIGVGPLWQKRITRPNLTDAVAQQQAQRVIADLKRHEWTATLTMPGEFELSARSVLLLEDTRSVWDRLFRVCQITRRLDVKRGFTQSLNLQGIV